MIGYICQLTKYQSYCFINVINHFFTLPYALEGNKML